LAGVEVAGGVDVVVGLDVVEAADEAAGAAKTMLEAKATTTKMFSVSFILS
jgi:hypothetical protein